MLAMTAAHPKAVPIVFAIMADPAFAVLVAQAYLKVLIVTGGEPALPAPN
jgi:hypothetical protein